MTITPTFEMSGSILAGTAEHRLTDLATDLVITGDATTEVLAEIVDQADRMCFVLDALRRPHQITSRVSANGEVLDRS